MRALLGRSAELGALPPRTLALLLLGPRVGGTKAYLEGLLEGLAPIILARLDEFNPHELFLLLSGWRRQARALTHPTAAAVRRVRKSPVHRAGWSSAAGPDTLTCPRGGGGGCPTTLDPSKGRVLDAACRGSG